MLSFFSNMLLNLETSLSVVSSSFNDLRPNDGSMSINSDVGQDWSDPGPESLCSSVRCRLTPATNVGYPRISIDTFWKYVASTVFSFSKYEIFNFSRTPFFLMVYVQVFVQCFSKSKICSQFSKSNPILPHFLF